VNEYKNFVLTVYSLFSLCNFIADFFKQHFFVVCVNFFLNYFLGTDKSKEEDHNLK